MIEILTNVLPIGFGYIMKLFSMNQQAKQDQQRMQLEALTQRSKEIDKAREQMNKESPMAAMNRRIIILVILGLVVFTQIAPVVFDIQTAVPVIEKGTSFLGFEISSDKETFITVPQDTIIAYQEVWSWATLIVEVYFGGQLAKK